MFSFIQLIIFIIIFGTFIYYQKDKIIDKFMSKYDVKLGERAQSLYDKTNIIKDINRLKILFDNEEDKEIVINVENELDNVMKGFKKSEIIPKSLQLDTEGRYLIGGFDIEKK